MRRDSEAAERTVEPATLVTQGRLWYLFGFDRSREDWRLFRLDRMDEVVDVGLTFRPRPAPDARTHLHRQPRADGGVTALLHLTTDAAALAGRVPGSYDELVSEDETGCVVRVSAGDHAQMAWQMVWVARDLGARLSVFDGDDAGSAEQLRATLRGMASEFLAAAESLSG